MKIVIFENEFNNLRTSFEAVNLLYFNDSLEFQQFNTFQDFGKIEKLSDFDFAIIDIDLSPKSELDGYQIIEKISELKGKQPKIIILTGHLNIEEQLKARNLPLLPIITKPVDFNSIKNALSSDGN
ncbi:MAG: response regulator [Flammeovirgaceae bacterium]